MHRTFHVAIGGAALTFGALVALPGVALAQEVVDCDDDQVAALYPDVCVDEPVTPIDGEAGGGGTGTPGTDTPATDTPATGGGTATGGTTTGAGTASTGGAASTLPFTGDEVLVLTLAGAGALAAGSALVVAGRRRRTPSA